MTLSEYFENLTKAYQAELEDLQSDSEGKNVLAKRLKDKREQFSAMMPMIEIAPEMVAVAFHGGCSFSNAHAMVMLASFEPDEFPSWDQYADIVQFAPWAEKLAEIALKEPAGESFLITTICLEYLYEKNKGHFHGNYAPDIDETDDSVDEVERDEDRDGDLEVEGADWLAEQGFDRH
ncbi:MAG: hypothetical protein NWQ13_03590 [Glaciimonas sp.]|nr:hypothetical protein [Glaciimonas sp.]